jgi:transcription initiation factor TFIIH subunit 2
VDGAEKSKDAEQHHSKTKGVSESGRYACEVCGNHFCIDCDVFAHEVVHNCPGCQSFVHNDEPAEVNGNGNGYTYQTNGAMELDT